MPCFGALATALRTRYIALPVSLVCIYLKRCLCLCIYHAGTKATAGINVYPGLNYSTVTFTLHLRRKPLYYVVNLVLPCWLLSLIAVTTFILQPGCQERLGLGK